MRNRLSLARFGAALLVALLAALPARAESTTLKVAYIPIMPMAQLYVLMGEGWAEEAGLDLELTRFSSGPAIVQALASGEYGVVYFGIGPAMVARANGIDVKVLAANGIEQVALMARGDLAGRLDSAASAAEGFAAFHAEQGRPAKIATLPPGSVPDTVLQHYLQVVAEIDPADVEVLGMGAGQVQQALLSGAIDGASILEPVLTIVAQRDSTARIVATGGEMLENQPGAILAVRERAIAAHPAAVQALVELHVRATELIVEDPQRAAAHVHAAIGQGLIDEATLFAALTSEPNNQIADPHSIIEATRRMHDFQAAIGTLRKPVPLDELFETRFYDAIKGRS
ncbi:MAG: ABC transporter substrate-binding protein [Inquilinus sp.]|nr:ABC transporter substrate-binding protein [Inquilinus sp.]